MIENQEEARSWLGGMGWNKLEQVGTNRKRMKQIDSQMEKIQCYHGIVPGWRNSLRKKQTDLD